MAESINLIPEQEVLEQHKAKLVRSSTYISIFVLLVVAIASGIYFYLVNQIKTQTSGVLSDIDGLRGSIRNMSDIEISARNLSKKYSTLQTLVTARPYYSLLLRELRVRQPNGVSLESFDVRGNSIGISGSAESYPFLSDYINNLTNTNFVAGNQKLAGIFSAVKLNSVDQSENSSNINFDIVVEYDSKKLKESEN